MWKQGKQLQENNYRNEANDDNIISKFLKFKTKITIKTPTGGNTKHIGKVSELVME